MEGTHSGLTGSTQPSLLERQTDGHIYEVAVQTNSTNRSSQFADVALLQTFKPLIIPFYILVVVVGVFGNYLLLYVICRTRKMHNVTNFFIGNLAFSDMLMCVTCVPFTLAYAFNPHGWVFGRTMCYLVFLIQPVTVYVSVFTLTAIAVDRWVLLVAYEIFFRSKLNIWIIWILLNVFPFVFPSFSLLLCTYICIYLTDN